jgi:hypothetical protein
MRSALEREAAGYCRMFTARDHQANGDERDKCLDRLSAPHVTSAQAALGDRSGSVSGHSERLTRPTAPAYTLAAHSSRSSAAV